MSRRAIFNLTAEAGQRPFDGQARATVVVEDDGRHVLVRVRPLSRREEAIVSLADVAEWAIWRHAKAKAAARPQGRGGRRR